MKILLQFQHYACAYYGVSLEYYEGPNNQISRIEQGNIVLGNDCRDKSYFILKVIKAEELRLNIINGCTNENAEEIIIAFADNIYFQLNRENLQENMNKILNQYIILHEIIGGKTQY